MADTSSPPTLAHGYANLVARHAQLRFLEQPYPTTAASILAVCHHEADLVMVFGGARHQALPCPDLAASSRFRGGATLLAGRASEWLPREMHELGTRVVAVVEGGPYAGWLHAHHPQVRLRHLPDRYAALAAVESGLADVAIGLEPTLRPLVRRHFNGSLRLQSFDSGFSTDLYLLVRHEDSSCWAASNRHYVRSHWRSMRASFDSGRGRRCLPRPGMHWTGCRRRPRAGGCCWLPC
ncbi:hypothetical protein [Stenotrophomonas sp. NRRL B-14846]|uniref:hypothetical protein n=1 Tax=Stenotrophomonas sp. NRRL B-14846 TaxID=3162882 RepID=UPI003D267168